MTPALPRAGARRTAPTRTSLTAAGALSRLLFLFLPILSGCAPEPSAPAQAQAFWDAVADARSDDAAALTVAGTLDARLRRLRVAGATVEALDVPFEASVAQLPTRLTRGDDERALATTTVLVRTEDGWRVDADATLDAYRDASVAELGERLGRSADRLARSFGASAEELARSARALGGALAGVFEESAEALPRRGDALAERVAPELEAAGDAIVEGLEALERALEDAAERAERRKDEAR